MSNQTILVLVMVVAIVALLAVRRRGPRITHIDRTVVHEKEGEK